MTILPKTMRPEAISQKIKLLSPRLLDAGLRLVQRESDSGHYTPRPIQRLRRAAAAENHEIIGVVDHLRSEYLTPPGIRMALGARASDVLRLVVAGGLKIVAIGIAIGLAAAAALTRLLATLLFGVTPLDPATFLGAPAVLALVALAACAAPALRAARVDPAIALRQE